MATPADGGPFAHSRAIAGGLGSRGGRRGARGGEHPGDGGRAGGLPDVAPAEPCDGTDVSPRERRLGRLFDGSGVRRGDVILFSARDWGANSVFMMRVIAVGGDHVVIDETGTRVSVNGKILREPYISQHDPDLRPPVDVTVPANRLFLLGENRTIAADSRAHPSEHSGTIARSAGSAGPSVGRVCRGARCDVGRCAYDPPYSRCRSTRTTSLRVAAACRSGVNPTPL
ncbi:signal peptidase I [Streptomyces spongiae]|uniref:Signal peptidase I n=1 Tax=Streptomyces spongiae TaxID=565072 RepID=A0A5N8XVY8_9ACTN|nr:signal peptidase I [Streptomyces spongiae]